LILQKNDQGPLRAVGGHRGCIEAIGGHQGPTAPGILFSGRFCMTDHTDRKSVKKEISEIRQKIAKEECLKVLKVVKANRFFFEATFSNI